MSKLEGKLPFIKAIYSFRATGELIKVVGRERNPRDNTVVIDYVDVRGAVHSILSTFFYDTFKRCKEGTEFHIQEGWNE